MQNSERIGIIPFTYFRGKGKPVGSTFLRVEALVNNNKDFEQWQHGKEYDALIFQKAYWVEMMRLFKGPKILDLCDPDWIRNGMNIVEIGELVHAITCSSTSLTKLLKSYFPDKIVVHVPDRLDLNFYPPPRAEHTGPAKSLIWFGFIHNAHETLGNLVDGIKKHELNLTIVANDAYSKEDEILKLKPDFHVYDHTTAYSLIKSGDIVLNPKSNKSFFKYKSNNKSIISWKLGLPVAESNAELALLMDSNERNKQVVAMTQVVETEYCINQSARQYREIIRMVKDKFFR